MLHLTNSVASDSSNIHTDIIWMHVASESESWDDDPGVKCPSVHGHRVTLHGDAVKVLARPHSDEMPRDPVT